MLSDREDGHKKCALAHLRQKGDKLLDLYIVIQVLCYYYSVQTLECLLKLESYKVVMVISSFAFNSKRKQELTEPKPLT